MEGTVLTRKSSPRRRNDIDQCRGDTASFMAMYTGQIFESLPPHKSNSVQGQGKSMQHTTTATTTTTMTATVTTTTTTVTTVLIPKASSQHGYIIHSTSTEAALPLNPEPPTGPHEIKQGVRGRQRGPDTHFSKGNPKSAALYESKMVPGTKSHTKNKPGRDGFGCSATCDEDV